MKKSVILMMVCALAVSAFGQMGKKTLAVDEVKVSKSLEASLSGDERLLQMKRVSEALDRHLMVAVTASRKFTIVGRRDLQSLIDEQDLATSGLVSKKAAEANNLTGADYKLVVFLDSFQEESAVATFGGQQRMKRRFQASAQATIYDSSTGEVLDAANIQTEKVDVVDVGGQKSNRPGGRMDEMIPQITRELADKINTRLLAVLFPAKIIDVDGSTVTINRGEGFFQVGMMVQVSTPGRKVVDPDTGEAIAIKGKISGAIRITSVEPTYAQGEIVSGEGIAVGSQITLP